VESKVKEFREIMAQLSFCLVLSSPRTKRIAAARVLSYTFRAVETYAGFGKVLTGLETYEETKQQEQNCLYSFF
jgi:hypothetical protein